MKYRMKMNKITGAERSSWTDCEMAGHDLELLGLGRQGASSFLNVSELPTGIVKYGKLKNENE
jgi:hypothetical protein